MVSRKIQVGDAVAVVRLAFDGKREPIRVERVRAVGKYRFYTTHQKSALGVEFSDEIYSDRPSDIEAARAYQRKALELRRWRGLDG